MKNYDIDEAVKALVDYLCVFLDKGLRPGGNYGDLGVLPPDGNIWSYWGRNSKTGNLQLNSGIAGGNFIADVNRTTFKVKAQNEVNKRLHTARPHTGGAGWGLPHFSANGTENENLIFYDDDGATFNFHLPCRPPACPSNRGGDSGGGSSGGHGFGGGRTGIRT